jgi:ribosomal protein S18 acetylase RimI-like enzyme
VVERFIENRLGRPGERFLLAELEDRAVAALRLAPGEGWVYITAFAALPEIQGRGVGRRLLRYAVDTLLTEGTLRIRIEVEDGNAAARALYESSGFALTSTFHYFSLPELAPTEQGP